MVQKLKNDQQSHFGGDMQFSGRHFPGIPACRHEGGREARSGRQYMLFCLIWAESLEFLG